MANIIGTPLEIINDDDILKEVLRKIGNNQQMLYQQIVKVVDFYRTAFASTDPETFFSTQILSGNILNVTIKSGVLYIYYKDGSKIKTIKFNLYPLGGGSSSNNNNNNNTVSASYGKGIVKLDAMLESGSTLPELAVEGTVVSVGGTIYKFSENQWSALEQEEAEGAFYAYGNKLYDFINGVITLVIDPGDALTQSSLETLNTAITTIAGLVGDPETGLVTKVNRLNTTINDPNNGIVKNIIDIKSNVEALQNKKATNIYPIIGIGISSPGNAVGNVGDYYFTSSQGLMLKDESGWKAYPSFNGQSPATVDRYPNTYVTTENGLYRILGSWSNYRLAKIAKNNVVVIDYWMVGLNTINDPELNSYCYVASNTLYKYDIVNGVETWVTVPFDKDVLYVHKDSKLVNENTSIEFPDLYYYDGENLIRFYDVFDAQLNYLAERIAIIESKLGGNDNTGTFDPDSTLDVTLREDKDFLIFDITTCNPGIFTINKEVKDITVADVINAYTVKTQTIESSEKVTCSQLGLVPYDGTNSTTSVETGPNSQVAKDNKTKIINALTNGYNGNTIKELVVDNMYSIYTLYPAGSSGNPITLPRAFKISTGGILQKKGFIFNDNLFITSYDLEIDGITFERKLKPNYYYNANGRVNTANSTHGPAILVNTQNHPDYLVVKNCSFIYNKVNTNYTDMPWIATSGIPTKTHVFTDDNVLKAEGNTIANRYYINHVYIYNNIAEGGHFFVAGAIRNALGPGGLTVLKSFRIVNNQLFDCMRTGIDLGTENTTTANEGVYDEHNYTSCPVYIVGNIISGSKKLMTRKELGNSYYSGVLTEGNTVYYLHNIIEDFVTCFIPWFGESTGKITTSGVTSYDAYSNVRQVYYTNNTIRNVVSYRFKIPNDSGNLMDDPIGSTGTFKAKAVSIPSGWGQYNLQESTVRYTHNHYVCDEDALKSIINATPNPFDPTDSIRNAANNSDRAEAVATAAAKMLDYFYLDGEEEYPDQGANFSDAAYLNDDYKTLSNGEYVVADGVTLTYAMVAEAQINKFDYIRSYIIQNFNTLTRMTIDGPQDTYSGSGIFRGSLMFVGNRVDFPVIGGFGGNGAWATGKIVISDNIINVKYGDSTGFNYRAIVLNNPSAGNNYALFSIDMLNPSVRETPRIIEIENNRIIATNLSGEFRILAVRVNEVDSASVLYGKMPKHNISDPSHYSDVSSLNISIKNNVLQGDITLAVLQYPVDGGHNGAPGSAVNYAIVLNNQYNEYVVEDNFTNENQGD